MKKTLIALAAVAVAGAASAQVTLSGKLAFGYVSDKVNNVSTTGLKATDGHFTLTANEDLGGGLKAIAKAEVLSRGRDTPISGRDASLSLVGGFGVVSVGAVESANPLNDYFGSDGRGLDGIVTADAQNVDFIRYTTPEVVPGLTFSVSKADQTGTGAVNANNQVRVIAKYAQGPIGAALDITTFKEGNPFQNVKSRTLIGGSYDLGVAKLSAGFETYKSHTVGVDNYKETALGVSMPVASNVSVGLTYATAKQGNLVDQKGYDLGATYSLSKRTNVNFSYASHDTGAVGADNDKYTRVRLTHSF